MELMILISVYCLLIVLASLCGGWLPSLIRMTHARMQLMVSAVGGLMLGVALFHLLPHSIHETGSVDQSVLWTMIGLLLMFYLLRAFHFHQHGTVEVPNGTEGESAAEPPLPPHDHAHHHHGHSHAHDHDHDAASAGQQKPGIHKLSWIGVTIGLALHTLIDGIALAASVQGEALHQERFWLFGLGTFLAILLHKPLDAMSITSLMRLGGWSPGWRLLVNSSFSLMCPLGAALFLLGVHRFQESQHMLIGCALGLAAGVFLCISLADLLPEVQFHSHDRFKLSAALLLGIAIAYGIGYLEPEHVHELPSTTRESSHPHDHSHDGGHHGHGHGHDHQHDH